MLATPLDELGRALRSLRLDRGWTQAQLARACGVTPPTVSRWEREVQLPSWEHLGRLLRVLGHDLGDVYTEQVGEAEVRRYGWPPRLPTRERLFALRREVERLRERVRRLERRADDLDDLDDDSAAVAEEARRLGRRLGGFEELWAVAPGLPAPLDGVEVEAPPATVGSARPATGAAAPLLRGPWTAGSAEPGPRRASRRDRGDA